MLPRIVVSGKEYALIINPQRLAHDSRVTAEKESEPWGSELLVKDI